MSEPFRVAPEKQFDFDLVRPYGSRVGLSFSCGKDSLAAWLHLRDHAFEVVPFYLELVPGLEFVEHSLAYYERRFGTRIIRYLHPNLYPAIDNFEFQPHERHETIKWLKVPLYKYDHVEERFREQARMDPKAWIAVATKRADSRLRSARIAPHALNWRRHTFMPVAEWSKADVFACLEHHRMPLPIDYELFGRSFDGWDYRFLDQIRRRFPRDYDRILRWFPEAELEYLRLEVAKRHGQAKLDKPAAGG